MPIPNSYNRYELGAQEPQLKDENNQVLDQTVQTINTLAEDINNIISGPKKVQEEEKCNVSVNINDFKLHFKNCKIIHDGMFVRFIDDKGECVVPISSLLYYEKISIRPKE